MEHLSASKHKKELYKEKVAINSLERHSKYEPGETVIILDHLDFCFSRSELKDIRKSWFQGMTVPEISKKIGRDVNEIFLALFDMTFDNRKNGRNNIILPLDQIRGGQVEFE